MTAAPIRPLRPQGILLATDLSARADRAEGRAVERATSLGVKLHVVTVIEPEGDSQPAASRISDPQTIEAELRESYGSDLDLEVTVETGEAWLVILREATAHDCALIVLGPAEPQGLQEKLLGSTAERVFHAAPMPVLTVRRRARGPYLQVVMATDFSATSRHAMMAAADVLPEAEFLLVHAYRVPFTGFLSREANEPGMKQEAEDDLKVFLASLDDEPTLRGRVRAELLYGTPDEVFGKYVMEKKIDLVVMGTHGTGGAFDKILGSTAERLLSQLPCDVMLSRLP
ncbi:universal stress protein [Bradyrhizobium viridifuturi]|jgi:nucleotide-binding universal stress UspA family protein|nr:universal stress protein [Bradyrhizobium viridifuturi]MBR1048623.1 universal stress protein [Bradyrhizobium viridifuturi]MBR1083726.1 universal stress protein [Bradyrhizobium viridifuturi]MBR1099190.1 universal stress protein [Bradyrhizobium viridifuturi]MBR1106346.1 universal stress protein [Bradyrhizobium viridifuturi]